MVREHLQRLLHTWQNFKEGFAVAGDFLCFGRQLFTEVMNLLSNVVMTKALISQCFTNDLQVGHSRHPHVGETPRRPKHFFEHRNGVLLISTNAERMNQRAVDVPEEDAKIWRGRGEWETRRRGE